MVLRFFLPACLNSYIDSGAACGFFGHEESGLESNRNFILRDLDNSKRYMTSIGVILILDVILQSLLDGSLL